MNSSLRKFVLLTTVLLLAAGIVCPPPEKIMDIPSARLLKGDVFKLDVAQYFKPQNVRIQGSPEVKFDSMISPAYREVMIPKYTFKNAAQADVTINMNDCLFGSFTQQENWALCGSEKDVTFWQFETNRFTNAVNPASLSVKYMGKDEATVTSNNISRCEAVVQTPQSFGKWILCFSKKTGETDSTVKLVFIHIHNETKDKDKTSPYSGVRSFVVDNIANAVFVKDTTFEIVPSSQAGNDLTFIVRRSRFDDNSQDFLLRTQIRMFTVSGANSINSSLTTSNDSIIDLKDVNINTGSAEGTNYCNLANTFCGQCAGQGIHKSCTICERGSWATDVPNLPSVKSCSTPLSNCQLAASATACAICSSGFALDTATNLCVADTTTIADCFSLHKTGTTPAVCKVCTNGKVPSADGANCTTVATDVNCQITSLTGTTQVCQACKIGFAIKTGDTTCTTAATGNLNGCLTTSLDLKTCLKCNSLIGFFMNDVNTACTNAPVPSPAPAGQTKFGETSQIQSIFRASGPPNELRFVIRVPDIGTTGELSELRFFDLKYTPSQSTYSFTPVNTTFGSLTRTLFGSSLKGAQLNFSSDGFYIATRQQVGFYKYGLANDKWTFENKIQAAMECDLSAANFVGRVVPVWQVEGEEPERRSVFVTYVDNDTKKKIKSYGYYNFRTNRYVCNTNPNSEGQSVVNARKLVSLEKNATNDYMLRHYRFNESSFLVLDYESIVDKTGAEKEISFDVANVVGSESAKFTIKVAAFANFADATRASVVRPSISAYPEEVITLPFRAHNLAGNNAQFVLKAGDKDLTADNSRVSFRQNFEITFQLPNETDAAATVKTFLATEIDNLITVDNNTFVAVKGIDYWIINCVTTFNDDNKPIMTCVNPPKKNALLFTSELITSAFRVGLNVVLVIRPNNEGSFTKLLPVNAMSMEIDAAFNDSSCVASSFDVHLDGPSAIFAYVAVCRGSGPTESTRTIKTLVVNQNWESKIVFDNSRSVEAGKLSGLCPQQINFESSSDANQKFRFIVRSQCVGKPSTINQIVLSNDYAQVTSLRQKEVEGSGLQLCPTRGEGLLFSFKNRRIYSYNYGNSDTYEYPLVEAGITQPLSMSCVAERNLAQIIGFDSKGVLQLATYIGGDSEKATLRLHSVTALDSKITRTTRIFGISTGYAQGSTVVTTVVDFEAIGAVADSKFKRNIYTFDLNGPVIRFRTPKEAVELTIGVKKATGSQDVKLKVNIVPVFDEVKIDPIQKFEKTGTTEFSVDLEKFLTYNGGVVNAKLSGSDKATLSGHRKTTSSSEGLVQGESIQMVDMYSSGKWTVFYFKDGATFKTDWEYDAARNDVNLPADQKVVEKTTPITGATTGMAHVPHPTDPETLITIRRYGVSELNRYVNKIQIHTAKVTKIGTQRTGERVDQDIVIPGFSVSDDFSAVRTDTGDIVIVERRSSGEFFNFYVLKPNAIGGYVYDETKNQSVTNQFSAIEYSVVFLTGHKRVVIIYTAAETAQLGFVVYNLAGGMPIRGWFDASDPEKQKDLDIVPTGVTCANDKGDANGILCFIDTFGSLNYQFKYSTANIDDPKEFAKTKTMVEGVFQSPKGFERVKSIVSGDFTGVLYQNMQKATEPANSIYTCRHILEVYKKPSRFAYITYTCEDFKVAATDNISVPKFAMFEEHILISQHQSATPPPPKSTRLLSLNESSNLSQGGSAERIGSRKTKAFQATIKDPNANFSSIMFEVIGPNGKPSTRSIQDLMSGKKETETGGSAWFWIILILIIIILVVVGFIVYKKMSGNVESQKESTYSKDVSNSRPSDLDDTRL